jgi:sugar transferase (PEP-CTERM system associated)
MPAWTFNHLIRTPLLLLGVGELLVLYSSMYVAAIVLYGSVEICEELLGPLAPRASILAIVMLASLISMGLYHFHRRAYFWEVFVRVAVSLVLGSLFLAVVYYSLPSIEVSHDLAAIAVIYALLMLLSLRYLFLRRIDENTFRRRTLIYGAGEKAQAIADLRRKADRRGFKIVGTVPAPGDSGRMEWSDSELQHSKINDLAMKLQPDEIVIAMDERRGNLPVRELLDAKLQGIKVLGLSEFLERETGKIRIDLVNPGWLLFSSGFRVSRMRRFTKRTGDLAVCSLLLLLGWPVMLITALAIKLEDGLRAPVLYRQERVGFRGRLFDVLKFRSMVENAEADGEAVWAQANDSRVTRVGKVLRKYRLDELPQLFNVLRGQMSLVGPRPERPSFVSELSESIPYYAERHTVKPGVTGWAQLRYPYGSSHEDTIEKLQYDLYYVKNQNVILDVIIILQTVEVVLWGKGAR